MPTLREVCRQSLIEHLSVCAPHRLEIRRDGTTQIIPDPQVDLLTEFDDIPPGYFSDEINVNPQNEAGIQELSKEIGPVQNPDNPK